MEWSDERCLQTLRKAIHRFRAEASARGSSRMARQADRRERGHLLVHAPIELRRAFRDSETSPGRRIARTCCRAST
jgi:hypothetical protein